MQILEIRTLRGPNYWSGYWKKLIIMRLDIGDYEDRPTDQIDGFYERMMDVMPSLDDARLQLSGRRRIPSRVREKERGQAMLIEHFALELQTLAGMDTGYGRTRETGEKGIYNVVFSYMEEEVGRFAGRAAVQLFLDLAEGNRLTKIRDTSLPTSKRCARSAKRFVSVHRPGSLVEEAESRDIPFIRLNDQSLVQLGYGVHQKRIQATTTANTNMISVDIAGNKHATKKLLGDMGVPVPKGFRHSRDRRAGKARSTPSVIQPL